MRTHVKICWITSRRTLSLAERKLTMAAVTGAIVINLDRRQDRLHTFTKSYYASALGAAVPLYRLPAVDGNTIDVQSYVTPAAQSDLEDLALTGRRKFHDQISPGAIGCYLSHMQAWKVVSEA